MSESSARDRDTANARRLASELQRYAGWLDKDRASMAVRHDVNALAAAIEAGGDPSACLETLDKSIGRLASGGVRKMLVGVLEQVRAGLTSTQVDIVHEDSV